MSSKILCEKDKLISKTQMRECIKLEVSKQLVRVYHEIEKLKKVEEVVELRKLKKV